MAIKNIIFDLGGVIMDIDFNQTAKAFRRLGITNFGAVFSHCKQARLIDDFEVGKMTPDQFRVKVKTDLNFAITDTEFDDAFSAMLTDLPKARLEFLRGLRKEYKIFLFSNSNAIHSKRITQICQTQHGFDTFSEYFEKEYYSYLLKKRKPDPEAFSTILKENNLKANETLFVDDTLQNVLAAKNFGLHAMHLDQSEEVFEVAECVKYIK